MGVTILQTITGLSAQMLDEMRKTAKMSYEARGGVGNPAEGLSGDAAKKAKRDAVAKFYRDDLVTNYLHAGAEWPHQVAEEFTALGVSCTAFNPSDRPDIMEVLKDITLIANGKDCMESCPVFDEMMADDGDTHGKRMQNCKTWGANLRENLEKFQRNKAALDKERAKSSRGGVPTGTGGPLKGGDLPKPPPSLSEPHSPKKSSLSPLNEPVPEETTETEEEKAAKEATKEEEIARKETEFKAAAEAKMAKASALKDASGVQAIDAGKEKELKAARENRMRMIMKNTTKTSFEEEKKEAGRAGNSSIE